MALSKTFPIYLNAKSPANSLIAGTSDGVALANLVVTSGDKFKLRVYFVETVGVSPTYYTPSETDTIVFAAKKRPSDSALVFLNTSWTIGENYIESVVDFNVATEFWTNAADKQKVISAEFEVRDVGNTERATWTFSLVLNRQNYGGETVPDTITPYLDLQAALGVFVAFDRAQELDEEEQAQAQENVGIGPDFPLSCLQLTVGVEGVTINGLTTINQDLVVTGEIRLGSDLVTLSENPAGTLRVDASGDNLQEWVGPIGTASISHEGSFRGFSVFTNSLQITEDSAINLLSVGALMVNSLNNGTLASFGVGDTTKSAFYGALDIAGDTTIANINGTDSGQVSIGKNGINVYEAVLGSSIFNSDTILQKNTAWNFEVNDGYLRVFDPAGGGYLFNVDSLSNETRVRNNLRLVDGTDNDAERFAIDSVGNVDAHGQLKLGYDTTAGCIQMKQGNTDPEHLTNNVTIFPTINGNGIGFKNSATNSVKLYATNTAERIYTLPDTAGTIVLTDSLSSSNAGKLLTVSSTDGKIDIQTTIQKIRNYDSRVVYFNGANFSVTVTGIGTNANGGQLARLLQGPTTGLGAGTARIRIFGSSGVDQAWAVMSAANGASNGIFDWNQELCFFGSCYFTVVNDNSFIFRISMGKLEADAVGDLASGRKGFEIKFASGVSTSLQLLVGNGTGAATTTTSTFQPVVNTRFRYMLYKAANSSSVLLYINETLVATNTNGPSGNTSSSTFVLLQEELESSGAAASFGRMVTGRGGMYGSEL